MTTVSEKISMLERGGVVADPTAIAAEDVGRAEWGKTQQLDCEWKRRAI
jgi:hypothetical protein